MSCAFRWLSCLYLVFHDFYELKARVVCILRGSIVICVVCLLFVSYIRASYASHIVLPFLNFFTNFGRHFLNCIIGWV